MRTMLAILLTALTWGQEAPVLREEILTADSKLDDHSAWLLGEMRKALPADLRLRLRWEQIYDMSQNAMVPRVAEVVGIDAQGREQGEERFYRAHVGLVRTRQWRDGRLDGIERFFDGHPDGGGKLFCRQEITWRAGVQEGTTRTLHPDGKPASETPYIGGKAEGLSRSWDAQGRLMREAPMRGGRRHGTVTDFWPETGKPKRVAVYVDGRVTGVVTDFYQDGARKAEVPFHDDARHGVEREFKPDGSLARTRWWIDGEAATEQAWTEAATKEAKP